MVQVGSLPAGWFLLQHFSNRPNICCLSGQAAGSCICISPNSVVQNLTSDTEVSVVKIKNTTGIHTQSGTPAILVVLYEIATFGHQLMNHALPQSACILNM